MTITITSDNWQHTLAALVSAGARRIYVSGPPGTGKTTFGAQLLGQGAERVAIHRELSAQELCGHFINRNGDTTFHEGPLTRSVGERSNLLLDELPEATGSALDFLRAVCDDSQMPTMLMDGRRMKLSHPGTIIGCGNLPVSRLPAPLADRFISVYAAEPTEALSAHIAARVRGTCGGDITAEAIADFFRKNFAHWDVANGRWKRDENPVTVRDFLRALDLVAGGMNFRTACDLTCKGQGESIADALLIGRVE